jgi:hypothetical protein
MQLSGGIIRKLIPAGAVAGVLAASLLATPPSLASSTNNCGVKGYGYHDHGKVCPNRPFPGQGKGLDKFGITVTTSSTPKVKVHPGVGNPASDATQTNQSAESLTTTPAVTTKGHGRGHAKHGLALGHREA